MKNNKLNKKESKILDILSHYKEGVRARALVAETGFPKRTIYHYLENLI